MILADPRWLYALGLVAALAIAIVITGRRHRNALAAVFTGAMLGRVLPTSVRVRRTLRDAALLVGLALAVVALAEPQYGEKVYTVQRNGVDIVLVLDLSRSMDCRDVDPSRLERVRREIADFLDVTEDDRIGIVGFAGGAFPLLPLTEDHEAVLETVADVDTNTFETQGSSLGAAIREADKLLARRKSDGDQAIVVFSDGEIHDPADALAAANEAKGADVRIFAVGVGDAPAPIPGPNGQYLRDRGTNAPVQSVPSGDLLTDLARRTGGAYVHSVAAASDVQSLYRDEIRARLGAAGRGTMQKKTHESGFQVPLGAALAALMFSAWLGDGRRAWGAAARIAMFGVIAMVSADALAADAADADAAYRSQRYGDAVQILDELVQDHPANPDLWDRLAAARYKSGDAEGAARAYEEVSRLKGGDADADFNAGNAHYAAHRLEDAEASYQEALKLDPDHPGAKTNAPLVAQELEARRKNQPQPPPKQDQSKDGGDKQDGDKQQDGDKSKDGEGKQTDSKKDQKPGDSSDQTPQEDPNAQKTTAQQQDGKQGEDSKNGQETKDDKEGGGPSDSVAPKDLQSGDPAKDPAADGGGGASTGDPDAPMSPAQATKMLDGVDEGHPRVVVPGDATAGKPW